MNEKVDELLKEYEILKNDITKIKSKINNFENLNKSISKKTDKIIFDKEDTENVKKIRIECYQKNLYSSKIKKVPSFYYDRPLEFRKNCLNASSIHQLCKSMIIENITCTRNDCSDKKNSKFYCRKFFSFSFFL
jgi:hypothetical protein